MCARHCLATLTLTLEQPGIALLTLFLSRAEVILQNVANGSEVDETPSADELQSWYVFFVVAFTV